jgi:glycosyltransferase involved in cell wall biosynthesis
MAERMVARGHEVEVATTCAQSYVDWANVFAPETTELHGVVVHRFANAAPRDVGFDDLHRELTSSPGPHPLPLQREWMRMQGPYSPDLAAWVATHGPSFDCVVCFTYLYWTTASTLAALAGRVPIVLHPTVHDEPALRLSIFDEVFRLPDAFALSTPEEAALIRRRFRRVPPAVVVGVGVDVDPAEPQKFTELYGLGDTPYLLYAGRVEEGKGARELLDAFTAYKANHPSDPIKLVFLGEAVMTLPERTDVLVTGFVDAATRDAALAGAYALVQPSRFESFSMVLTEAFAHGRPALVQGDCAVLRGHAQRSGAAIPYRDARDFDAALHALREDADRVGAMGDAGRAYVAREYEWDVVLDKYESLLSSVMT